MRCQLKMEDIQIVEDALVCPILACSATVCCQEEQERRSKCTKIWIQKLLLYGNKYGAHVVTVNALRENDVHSFRRFTNEK